MKINITKKYLVFPANTKLKNKTLTLWENTKKLYDLNFKIDNISPDFYAHIDVSEYIGKELELSVCPKMNITCTQTDTIPADADEIAAKRPRFHFTTKNGWLNDPNGLVYINGEYHMFYQYNPADTGWGNMHWGHAVSTDLMHWVEKDIALFPDDTGMMFSGSGIIDEKNLLGLSDTNSPAVLFFYTATNPFSQHMAYSTDSCKTLKKYTNNPVVPNIVGENRDPKVIFCDELNCYIMALYLDINTYAILKSDNLTAWDILQKIEMPDDSECPDIFPLYDQNGNRKWIFMGAKDTYITGEFKDGKFMQEQEIKKLHYGKHAYAGQTFSNIPDGRRIRVTWDKGGLNGDRFTSQMMLPTEYSLLEENGEYFLITKPVKEIETLFGNTVKHENISINSETEFELDKKGYLIKIKGNKNQTSNMTFNILGHEFKCDSRENTITCLGSTAELSSSDQFEVTAVIDTGSIELFFNNGKAYMAFSEFTDYNLSAMSVKSDSENIVDCIEITEIL